ncbi:MAG TPA: LytTR family DNA-binding domain-containing protein [Parafilimonas sp.]|nr:LytTR family DNA-binding domain-containing protein [Parafilimonas sp.]
MILKAIIVDDEPNAREKLQLMIERFCRDVEVFGVARDAEEGLAMIGKHQPDLVFLDIEMPVLTGFDMLKQIPEINFEIIFTTAHDEYAIRAIKFSALDYLLKPIDLEQLQLAIQKAATRKTEKTSTQQYLSLKENLSKPSAMEQLAVPAQTGMLFLKVRDIVYCEADSNYTKIMMLNKQKVVSTRTLKEYEELLTETGFIRIHHSWLINKTHVKQYVKGEGGQVIMNDGTALDVSRRKKEYVIERLKN